MVALGSHLGKNCAPQYNLTVAFSSDDGRHDKHDKQIVDRVSGFAVFFPSRWVGVNGVWLYGYMARQRKPNTPSVQPTRR